MTCNALTPSTCSALVHYTPNSPSGDFVGTDTFTYRATDGDAAQQHRDGDADPDERGADGDGRPDANRSDNQSDPDRDGHHQAMPTATR